MAITSACLFGARQDLRWPNAWALLLINLLASIASSTLLSSDPDLLAERSNTRAGKKWDKPLVFVMVLLGPVAVWVTAGLDVRFHWSRTFGAIPFFAGAALAVLAAALVAWAMRCNRFFSAVVRIQKDRGQVVITTGPYGFIRHPAYAGMCAFTLATPLILGSRWALVPAIFTTLVTILRTALEDRTLLNELEGYTSYTRSVRFRLLPRIW